MLAPSEYEGTPTRGYLDSATFGLPPRSTLAAMEDALAGWRTGRRWRDWEEDGEACRELFAGLVGARAEDVALVGTTSVATGLVAASLPVEEGANVVLYERDFTSAMLPFRTLEPRGVELRLAPLERLAEAVDEHTALVSVSLVQSAEGRVVDLDALRAAGAPILLDATQAVGAYPVDLTGVDYLVAHGYKWLLCPRGLTFFYVSPERRLQLEPLTAGWKSRLDPYADYYGLPELTPDARRLDVSLPWFSAAGGRPSLELFACARRRAHRRAQPRARRRAHAGARAARAGVTDRPLPGRGRRGRRPAAAGGGHRVLGPGRLGPPLVPPLQRRGGRGARGGRARTRAIRRVGLVGSRT